MKRSLRPDRALLGPILVVGGALVAMGLAYTLVRQRTLGQEVEQLHRQSQLHSQSLQQRVDRYRTLPQVLALDPELLAAVSTVGASSIDETNRRIRLNQRLEGANSVTRSSTLTLIDRHGVAIAASNWRLPTSNVGGDYSFRPYFKEAVAEGRGRFYGIGLTTGAPGYFLSEAIRDADGRVAGVIVIKIELEALEQEWLETPDVVLVTDAQGVVFLSSRGEWRYRTLAPLDDDDRREIAVTRQYPQQLLAPLEFRPEHELGAGTRQVRSEEDGVPSRLLWQTATLAEEGWQVHLLHDASAAPAAGRSAAIAAGGVWLALAFLSLFVLQRQRLFTLRQRSRDELEAVLQQHAQELRTAQDVVVETARQADAGLSRSLEHLPQGVVIIDAALQLVAWNSRYVELFRFPLELLRVGQPIEALIRHNAVRGLLGPGPIDEAIERRLDHLRSGKPHLRESEKDDGTVLEIRGTPLPDGGFVTSYADITTYKNAARELRSLADSLERRVDQRTRALVEAKQEAERANRYKTRFVAAAVHDLLQPLNAARMFLSALRSRVDDPESVRIAERIDSALSAQDAILNSLLDISRMESGALPTRIADVPLAPLLDALSAEFGILAENRGLRLRRVATRAVVRTDEALLRRILQNFLSNAIRYTPEGRILLGCRRVPEGLRIEVHDQGPGIPESLRAEVFEEFRRLDDGVADDRGAGLGLAIVERLGRLLGHCIGLRSRLGIGSVFSVTVPRGDATAVIIAPPWNTSIGHDEDSGLRGQRVWCIDDDPLACEATRLTLERWGCRVEVAGGVDAFTAAASGARCPDILLLDVHLGEADGPRLYDQFCGGWNNAVPVVLLTAERGEAIRTLAAARGWSHLGKPVRPSALRSVLMQVVIRHSRVETDRG